VLGLAVDRGQDQRSQRRRPRFECRGRRHFGLVDGFNVENEVQQLLGEAARQLGPEHVLDNLGAGREEPATLAVEGGQDWRREGQREAGTSHPSILPRLSVGTALV
jgi:hypothetical protein